VTNLDIRIVNWLLTRRCNLRCHYCGIVKNVPPNLNEVDHIGIELALHILEAKWKPFYILYGGEPFVRDDIECILMHFMTKAYDRFTIYHNGTMPEKVYKIVSRLELPRLTTSVDPVSKDKHRDLKSQKGIQLLDKVKHIVKDRVATITIDKTNYDKLIDTVEMLTDMGIVSNITTFDPPGTTYYDFSVSSSEEVERLSLYPHHIKDIFAEIKERALNGELLVHYPELLDVIVESLPRNYRCSKPWSSLTIDADLSLRLCLRIGARDKLRMNVFDLVRLDQDTVVDTFRSVQNTCCNGCVWTCIMMSENSLDVRKHK